MTDAFLTVSEHIMMKKAALASCEEAAFLVSRFSKEERCAYTKLHAFKYALSKLLQPFPDARNFATIMERHLGLFSSSSYPYIKFLLAFRDGGYIRQMAIQQALFKRIKNITQVSTLKIYLKELHHVKYVWESTGSVRNYKWALLNPYFIDRMFIGETYPMLAYMDISSHYYTIKYLRDYYPTLDTYISGSTYCKKPPFSTLGFSLSSGYLTYYHNMIRSIIDLVPDHDLNSIPTLDATVIIAIMKELCHFINGATYHLKPYRKEDLSDYSEYDEIVDGIIEEFKSLSSNPGWKG